jgi:hypothetical protein
MKELLILKFVFEIICSKVDELALILLICLLMPKMLVPSLKIA